jgi:methylthioribose-1-phosphate isomerase
MGIALGAREIIADTHESFFQQLSNICDVMAATRPTAVNLFWAIERMKRVAETNRERDLNGIREILRLEAIAVEEEDLRICRAIGANGAAVIREGSTVLTHCNAGGLATAGYGTALGVIRAAHDQGKNIRVFADETRPWLQGARLTVWELMKDNIPVTLITDSMAGYFMKKGEISCCVVGADRIAANGDTANKIGTYTLSILAKEHKIPFYVAAPSSTFDLSIKSGDEIPIEQRAAEEVTKFANVQVAPQDIKVINPAFDVTEARDITAIITEKGIVEKPDTKSIIELLGDDVKKQ